MQEEYGDSARKMKFI